MKAKKSLKLILINLTLILSSIQSFGQKDSVWSVMLIKKGKEVNVNKNTPFFLNDGGFYLHIDMLYSFELQDGAHTSGRLMDIKEDSLVVANYYNEKVALKNYDSFAIKTLHYSEFKKLNLIADRAMGINKKVNLKKYEFVFSRDTAGYFANIRQCPRFYSDTLNDCETCKECYLSLGHNALDLISEVDGQTYYYMGMLDDEYKNDTIQKERDTTWVTRNVIGFAPANRNTKINGWALSAMAMTSYHEDTLIVNGLNTEIGMGFIMLPYVLYGLGDPMPVEEFKKKHQGKESTTINGLSVSALGNINKYGKINGVSLNGAITASNEVNGLVASFGANIVYEFNGLTVCGLRNHSVIGNGVQIGLVNKCTKLRGFQFGLINKNQKRTLPFINWCFSD